MHIHCRSVSSSPRRKSTPSPTAPRGLCAWSAISAARFLKVWIWRSLEVISKRGESSIRRSKRQPSLPLQIVRGSARSDCRSVVPARAGRLCVGLPSTRSSPARIRPRACRGSLDAMYPVERCINRVSGYFILHVTANVDLTRSKAFHPAITGDRCGSPL